MMFGLYVDTAGGVAGDMWLAAMLGLAGGALELAGLFRSAGLPVGLDLEQVRPGGLAGVRLALDLPGGQPLRHLAELLALVERLEAAGLPPAAAERSRRALGRLAEVEAAVHGIPVANVHFHEVGALDTIVDVVGACWARERLAAAEIVCSPLPWFRGTVDCAHGTLPLPAPAVCALLAGKPVEATAARDELITPTGALLVDQLVDRFAPGPRGVIARTVTAYGSRYVEGRVNGLRMVLYRPAAT